MCKNCNEEYCICDTRIRHNRKPKSNHRKRDTRNKSRAMKAYQYNDED